MSLLVGPRRSLLVPNSFSILSLPGLQLWLRASNIAGNDGDSVATWTDLSGKGNHVTQATGLKQPILKRGIVNGLDVVRFDGLTQFLSTAAFGVALAQPNTMFAVLKLNGGQGASRSIMDGNGANRNSLTASTANFWSAFGGSTLNDAATETSNFHVVEVLFNGASGAVAQDGVQTLGNTGTNAQGAFVIGIDRLGVTAPAPIDLAELVFCSGSLFNRTPPRKYLAAEHNLIVA